FPEFDRMYIRVPEYPPIQVWYAWITDPYISQLDPLSDEFRQEHARLVEWWNGQLQGEGGQVDQITSGAQTASGTQTTSGASSRPNSTIFDRVLRALQFNPTVEAEELINMYGDQALAVLEANEQALLDSGYTQTQLNWVKYELREKLGIQEQSPGGIDPDRLQYQIIKTLGAAMNAPFDVLLYPFGLRVSRDPAVAEENVRRGHIALSLLSL